LALLETIDKTVEGKPRHKKSLSNKNKIILGDTFLPITEYFKKVKELYNGKFEGTAHFSIDKTGKIYQHLPYLSTNRFIEDFKIDDQSFTIALENLNSIEMSTLSNGSVYFMDWRGVTNNDKVYEKCWRNTDYWDQYTENQVKSLKNLCEFLCENFDIQKKFINTNTKTTKAIDYNGIVSRSNFSKYFNDVNPSFNFSLLNQINHENKRKNDTKNN
jgi:N-acetyl-anhydromuramyl-L-alanine amidase AmpD